jgi:hypothetical protein
MLPGVWSSARRAAVVGIVAVALAGIVGLGLLQSSASAAECDPGLFQNPDGSLDVTGYLQCTTPTVSDETVPPGGAVTFSGGGFAPDSLVTVTLFSEPIVLGTTTADDQGNFSITVVLPADVPPGDHHLEASGVDPDGNPLTVTLPLTVASEDVARGGGPLPTTGSDVRATVAIACAVMVLGAAALTAAGRRRRA